MSPLADKMLNAWFEGSQRTAVMLRWLFTEWCNYRCPYCPQTHDRHAPKGGKFTEDFARNVTANPFGLYAEELRQVQTARTGT